MSETHEMLARRLEHDLDGRPGWAHGSLLAMLDGLTVEQALWKAAPDKRCIWAYVRHMRMWREHVALRMEGAEPAAPDDEWPAPGADDAAWREDLAALRSTTERIARALRGMPDSARHPSGDDPAWMSVLGVLQHDSFHVGQIAVLRGLQGLDAVS